MPVIAIVGAQWGDEGKGKVVDQLAQRAAAVVRYSGGDNAGHSVTNPSGDFKLHIVPSGIFSSRVVCIIGNGVAINPKILIDEIEGLNKRGVDTSKLFISDRAHLIMPYHILFDGLEEEARAGKAIGTTRKGVGPAFTDKVARMGIRTCDLFDQPALKERLAEILKHKNAILTGVYKAKPLSLDEVYREYCGYAERLRPYVRETTAMIEELIVRGELVLLEGAQGALLDTDFGTYPFATSSSPLAGGACLGAGIGPTKVDRVLAVFKAYCTRVGAGPMPTELNDETGNLIRERAHEYGTTTGRARRCGWYDAIAARFSTRINGFTGAAVTRLDILDVLPKLKICVGYRLDGQEIDYFPASVSALGRCEPIYEEMSGWQKDTTNIRSYEKLPLPARRYLDRLSVLSNCPINFVCVGPGRDQTIEKTPIL
jgi:adenylosuccinate synthase